MTATTLTREQCCRDQHATSSIDRPPTLFGRTSPWPVVEAGHNLANRAVGYALEQRPRDEAVRSLLEQTADRDVAHMAWHYLAFTRFDVGYAPQAQALFFLDDVLGDLDERQRRQALPLHRAGVWLRDRLARLRRKLRLPPTGGRLRLAV
jgi:hypothetical protein